MFPFKNSSLMRKETPEPVCCENQARTLVMNDPFGRCLQTAVGLLSERHLLPRPPKHQGRCDCCYLLGPNIPSNIPGPTLPQEGW